MPDAEYLRELASMLDDGPPFDSAATAEADTKLRELADRLKEATAPVPTPERIDLMKALTKSLKERPE